MTDAMGPVAVPLSLAQAACLALIAEQPQHGWAIARQLAPDGAIGRVWSLSRPLTYRAIDDLVALRLVGRKQQVPGAGPKRQLLAVTPSGRRAVSQWFVTPVEHLRDVRTELLLKMALCERAGLSTATLLGSQRSHFERRWATLTEAGTDAAADHVDRWRYESSLAVQRFIDESLRRAGAT